MTTITSSSPISSPYQPSTGNNHANKSTSSGTASGTSIIDQFLSYQHLSPQQKIRQAILEKLGLSEDDLNAMQPEARNKIEDEIKQEFEKQIKGSLAQKGILLDITV